MSPNDVVDSLRRIEFVDTFNPYFDRCSVHDNEEAPELRRYYLVEMLERAARSDLDAIWVGRDLGYRGGRRTGLALTDDIHFSDHLGRWGLEVKRPTRGEPVAERTATVIWDFLLHIKCPVFLWNVFPLHPYEKGDPFSNRAHNADERRAGVEVLIRIIKYIRPRRIVAIGNDAYSVLSALVADGTVRKVRHPSYGGHTEFLASMKELYADDYDASDTELF